MRKCIESEGKRDKEIERWRDRWKERAKGRRGECEIM